MFVVVCCLLFVVYCGCVFNGWLCDVLVRCVLFVVSCVVVCWLLFEVC